MFATGCDACSGETDGTGTVIDNDSDDDGVCDEDEIDGCTDPLYEEYNSSATDDDGSCETLTLAGCTDELACNYNDNATDDDDSCFYAEEYFDCDGNAINDSDGDGIPDELEINGCTDELACNYNPDATDDFLNVNDFINLGGFVDGDSINLEEVSCVYVGDEGGYLTPNGGGLEFYITCIYNDSCICVDIVYGCTDELACNYDPEATDDDDSCFYAEEFFDCDGNAINDSDGDGIPDELEVIGC